MKKRNGTILTQERLKELVIYDKETGIMVSKVDRYKVKKGSKLGTLNKGYLYAKIDNKRYSLHGLAFLYEYGFLPDCDIDHINGDKQDNRIENLREATRSQNASNAKLNKRNELKLKNIRKLKDTGKYQVRVKNTSFGCYEDLELAKLVAISAREICNKEFARHS